MKHVAIPNEMRLSQSVANLTARIAQAISAVLVIFIFSASAQAQTLQLSLPELSGSVGEQVTIPVTATNIANKGIASFVVGVKYDPAILESNWSVSTNGTISAGVSASKFQAAGEIRVIYARATTDPIDQDGVLFNLTTEVIGTGETTLEISSVSYLENGSGSVTYTTVNGSFSTAADPDGVSDDVENNVPNLGGGGTGDGNGDGTQDSEQANVASLPNGSGGGYVTIASDTGTRLRAVATTSTPPAAPPAGVSLPDGVISFDVLDITPGGSATVDIFTSSQVKGYYKYGPRPGNATSQWYYFNYDGTTGAEVLSDRIVLHLVDGGRGDADLSVNGVIADPGAPAFYQNLAPTAPEIMAPTAGAEFVVGGETGDNPVDGGAILTTIDWEDSADPDGDPVSYRVEVSGDDSFSATIDQVNVDVASELNLTVAQAASWLDEAHGSTELGAERTLHFRVIATDGTNEASSEVTSANFVRGTVTSTRSTELPGGFALKGNYPNPFNPSTTIRFDLPQSADVSVQIFDLLGRQVFAVPATALQAGADRTIRIEAGDLSSGTYVYRVVARNASNTMVDSGRMTLLK